METWKDIPGYEGLYQASSLGRIKRVKGIAWNGYKHHEIKERILKPHCNHPTGYAHVALSKNGKPKTLRVHVLVCLAFIGKRPDNHHILHMNGDSKDNRACNLRYGTPKENIHQAYQDSGTSATRNQRLISFNGVTKDCSEWSKSLGGNNHLVQDRLSQGWSIEDALTTPALTPRTLSFNGETLSVKEWAKKTGLSKNLISARLRYGWSIEDILTKPTVKTYELNGKALSIPEWAKELGIPVGTIKDRLRRGWSIEKALNQ
jgi:hypothetical protein